MKPMSYSLKSRSTYYKPNVKNLAFGKYIIDLYTRDVTYYQKHPDHWWINW